MPPVAITDEQMKEALMRSGYLLESRLEACLRARNYHVETSAAVPDPKTGISREMDIYALTGEHLRVRSSGEIGHWVFGVVLVECLNNPTPIVFFTKETSLAPLFVEKIRVAGLPVSVQFGSESMPLPMFLDMQEYHHYCEGPVATQWCSFTPRDKNHPERGWIASHDDVHFNDLSKLCAAVDFYMDRHFRSWVPGQHETLNLEFYNPVLVVQGELVDVHVSGTGIDLARAEHLQFHRSVIAGSEEKEYRIDVVTERHFPAYLDMLEEELRKTADRLLSKWEHIERAITELVEGGKRRPIGQPAPGIRGKKR